jgi:hypothetical protein
MLGFRLEESWAGSYYMLDEPLRDYAIKLHLHLSVDGVRRFVRDREVSVSGRILDEHLTARALGGAKLTGHLGMKLFDEKRIPYDVSFVADDGKSYRLRGQRDFFVHNAFDSLTMLPASLYRDDVEVGRALLRFDPRMDLAPFVKSFRPTLSRPRWRSASPKA